MTTLERAALFEQVTGMLEEIEDIFKEYGYDPKEFDEDLLEDSDDEITQAYGHIYKLKNIVEQ